MDHKSFVFDCPFESHHFSSMVRANVLSEKRKPVIIRKYHKKIYVSKRLV